MQVVREALGAMQGLEAERLQARDQERLRRAGHEEVDVRRRARESVGIDGKRTRERERVAGAREDRRNLCEDPARVHRSRSARVGRGFIRGRACIRRCTGVNFDLRDVLLVREHRHVATFDHDELVIEPRVVLQAVGGLAERERGEASLPRNLELGAGKEAVAPLPLDVGERHARRGVLRFAGIDDGLRLLRRRVRRVRLVELEVVDRLLRLVDRRLAGRGLGLDAFAAGVDALQHLLRARVVGGLLGTDSSFASIAAISGIVYASSTCRP